MPRKNYSKKNEYPFNDMTLVCGLVNDEPKINTAHSGKSYASFTVGERYGRKDENGKYKYKNYRCAAYDEIGNEIMAQVQKNDSVMVIGHISAYPYTDKNGRPAAGLWLNVTQWEKNPKKKQAEAKIKELTQEQSRMNDEEEEQEETNAETLWGIDF